MDWGQIIFITVRLVLEALAAFCAIMLWSKTRDAAWMLVVIGTIVIYLETVYSVLDLLGISGAFLFFGSVPPAAIVLFVLRCGFFIAAFLVMVFRRYHYR